MYHRKNTVIAAKFLGTTNRGMLTESISTYNEISFNDNNFFETEVEKFDCKESTKMAA